MWVLVVALEHTSPPATKDLECLYGYTSRFSHFMVQVHLLGGRKRGKEWRPIADSIRETSWEANELARLSEACSAPTTEANWGNWKTELVIRIGECLHSGGSLHFLCREKTLCNSHVSAS